MEISDVQVKPVVRSRGKLKAFCTVTFDESFVIKDVRLIEGTKGLLVAMPVKKFTFRCYKCGCQNPLSARFCSDCGRRVRASKVLRNSQTGKPLLQVDVAHPITSELRQKIEEKIVDEYNEALKNMPQDTEPAPYQDEAESVTEYDEDDGYGNYDSGKTDSSAASEGSGNAQSLPDDPETTVQDDPLQKHEGHSAGA